MPSLSNMKAAIAKNKAERKAVAPKPVKVVATTEPVWLAKSPMRTCCNSPRGKGPHLPECSHLQPKKEKKPKSPHQFDAHDETFGRWPVLTEIRCVYLSDGWHVYPHVPGEQIFERTGSAIHKLLPNTFTEWVSGKSTTNGEAK